MSSYGPVSYTHLNLLCILIELIPSTWRLRNASFVKYLFVIEKSHWSRVDWHTIHTAIEIHCIPSTWGVEILIFGSPIDVYKRQVVHSDRGCHYRWPGWLELMERYGLTRSMSAKGCSPDNAAAEGFFGRMKTESVYPEHWEKRTRDEVLVLIDEYIHWYNHERIKQSLGWMSPVQYRQSQGMAA